MANSDTRLQPNSFTVKQIALLKNLYLRQGLNAKDIAAKKLGLSVEQVHRVISNRGWAKIRKESQLKMEQEIEDRMEQEACEVAQAIAAESEELSFGALDLVRKGIKRGGANGSKQAQAGSAALKNLVGVTSAIRKPGTNATSESKHTSNFFFLGVPSPVEPPPMRTAEPVSETVPTESEAVDFDF